MVGECVWGGEGVSWLDVSAVLSEDNHVNLAIVNISAEEDIEVDLKGCDGTQSVNVYTVNGDGKDVVERGGKGVGMKEDTWDGRGKYKFPKHSLTLLRWKA